VDLNKKSVKQQGKAMIPNEPGMQPQQPQANEVVMQVQTFISEQMKEGQEPVDIVMALMTQQVDQEVIGQALMMSGYEQDDVMALFEEVKVKANPEPADAEEVNSNPQELARNEEIKKTQQGVQMNVDLVDAIAKSGIEIKKKNRGKFTKWAKARGMGVQEAARKVMANKDKYPPSVVKMANFARNAAKWKKDEGGENTNAAAMNELNKYSGFMFPSNVRVEDQDNNILVGSKTPPPGFDINTEIEALKQEDFIRPDPFYVNPIAFESPNNFNIGKAANVAFAGFNRLFGKDGSLTPGGIKKTVAENKINKFLNSDYVIDIDRSDENLAASNAFKEAFKKYYTDDAEDIRSDNVGVYDFLKSKGVDFGFKPQTQFEQDVTNVVKDIGTGINTGANDIQNWLNKNLSKENLNSIGTETLNALETLLQGKKTDEGKFGGPLPKAQTNINMDYFANFDPNNPLGLPDFNQVFENQTNYGLDTRDIDINMFRNDAIRDSLPDFSTLTGQTNYAQDIANIDIDAIREQVMEERRGEQDAELMELFSDIKLPNVTREDNRNLGDRIANFKNTAVGKAFADVSQTAVEVADVINDYFEDVKIRDARDELKKQTIADRVYATRVDPFNSRGTFDVNTGIMGSEGDRTTGLYMTKKGGEKKDIVEVDSKMLAKLIAAGADIEML
jgi:hypothetical protein